MTEAHPFTIKIDPDPLGKDRHRWSVCEGVQIIIRSPHAYATRSEAETEANAALAKHASTWRPRR